ncbi:alkaline phosphatase family protein [Halogeometricum limi]|uniref:alkaline phosphatase family protein n=1 Tax=Halogeometricum limi TaxID=555875 RepID=UPI000B7FBE00|nr:alkaline phosphatase family protein [Halogeometricum limi]
MNDTYDETRRAFVLGLDGVPWGLLEGFVDDGELPNFERLLNEGASGPLRSTTPANTPVAWPSIATGTWPDKHGLYEFMKLDSSYKQSPYSSADVKQPPLWELVSPSVVANVPMTYPTSDPGEDSGIVSGMMTPQIDGEAVNPESLREEFDRRIPDYEIDIKWRDYAGREDEFLDDLDHVMQTRHDLMELLMENEDWRLFFFVYVAPDRLQHLIWDDETLLAHYKKLDDILGEVMDYCEDRDSNLYVVSDHGFAPIEKVISVNRILADEGLLTTKDSEGARGVLSGVGLNKDRVQGALQKAGITDDKLVQTLPKSVVDFFAERIPGSHGLYDVEFDRTDAFLHGLGSVYINDTERFEQGTVPPKAVSRTKREVVRVLEAATDPETGDPLLTVHDGDELFPNDPDAPDIVVEAKEGYHVEPKLAAEAVEPATDIAAYHRPHGIFFAWGDDVSAGTRVEDADVVDVAPTVLHSLGQEVPELADGDVLAEIFDPDSAPATEAVQTNQYTKREGAEATATDTETVEDRLRGLGYME